MQPSKNKEKMKDIVVSIPAANAPLVIRGKAIRVYGILRCPRWLRVHTLQS